MKEMKEAIAEQLTMKDLGELQHFLGVTVDQKTKPGVILLGQPVGLHQESVREVQHE